MTGSPIQAIRRRFCWATSTASTAFPATTETPTPGVSIAATTASFSIDRGHGEASMIATHRTLQAENGSKPGHRIVAVRLLAAAGCAAMLAGCVTDHTATATPTYPMDLRQRHPISIREGVHTVELFIGSRRSELTLDQRADVLSFAHNWRRDSAGGIIIDVPSGSSNAAA